MLALEQRTNLNIKMMMQNTYDTFNELSLKRMADMIAGFAIDNVEMLIGRLASSQLTNSVLGSKRGGEGTEDAQNPNQKDMSLGSIRAPGPNQPISLKPSSDKKSALGSAKDKADKLSINIKKIPSLYSQFHMI